MPSTIQHMTSMKNIYEVFLGVTFILQISLSRINNRSAD